jgi:hypothetical protein
MMQMMMTDQQWLDELVRVAKDEYDGHFTIMRFTTNWRVGFGTVNSRREVCALGEGETFAAAAEQALMFKHCADDADEDACPCRTKYNEELEAWGATKP